MVKLPHDALDQLAQLRAEMIGRGEVFWLPGAVLIYHESEKPRPCLVAALDNGRAHLVPGTSKTASGPAVVIEPGEAGLPKRTEFDFSVSFPLALHDLVAKGTSAGVLAADRLPDVDTAIKNSNLVALKRLMGS